MLRTKNNWLTSLALTIGCVIPSALSAGCAESEAISEDVSESAATLGVEVASCSQAGSAGYSAMSSNLTLTMGSVTSLVFGVVNGYVTVNGYACVKPTMAGGGKLKPADVKKVTITGTSGDDKVVIDTLSGALGATILAATGGITVDLAGETMGGGDTFSLRGSSNADKWAAGLSGSDTYFELSGDAIADLRLIGAEAINVSLSSGADIFTAQGGTYAATHLAGSTVATLSPATAAMTINGGEGDDVITGGNGADTINGGAGNDIYKAALADGADTFNGGPGTDKADYSVRTAALTFVMDATAGGESMEGDKLALDVEDFVGGGGNDTITGNVSSNHIQGGNGNDTINGGANAGSCTADIDILDGEGGNDTFTQGTVADCTDTVNGGAGTDRIDYQDRTADLGISLDGTGNDGDTTANEKDNIKNDVEIVLGGKGNDTIVGSANNDELHGGPGNDVISGGAGNDTLSGNSGNDVLNGEAGDDTFDESGVDAEYLYMTPENKGDGNDTMNGGTHDTLGLDTASYAARSAPVTATLCMDATKLTGSATGTLTGQCADNDGESGEQDKLVNVTHLIGGGDDDTLKGHTADDIIEGGAGDDAIFGGAGNDTLFGDAGDDTLTGDAGDDYLDGGAAGMAGDTFDGDNGTDTSDGDICLVKTGDTATHCEL
jgi:Ca2+-binding RTX toxin-like protein